MPSPPDDYGRRRREPRGARYEGDIDDEDYSPPKRSHRRPKYPDDDLIDREPPPLSRAPEPPSATRADPRDVAPNMKASRRDKYPPADDGGIEVLGKDDDRGYRRSKPARRYSDDEDDRSTRHSAKSRSYTDEDDGSYRSSAPRRSKTVRESGRDGRGTRSARTREDDRYNSSYDELPRPSRRAPVRDYDDREKGYKSDGREARRRSQRYDEGPEYEDRGYKSSGGRYRSDYDLDDRDRYRRSDRARDRDRDRERDRDRDRGYRSDDYHRSRRGYESDRGGYRSERDRDRYYDDDRDRRDRRRASKYDDDRDRDRAHGGGGSGGHKPKIAGFEIDPKKIPKYIEQGQKHYHTVKPLIDSFAAMYKNR